MGRVEEIQYVGSTYSTLEVVAVKMSKCSGWNLLPWGINQARDLVSRLDAHVTQ